jgi:apolipoprotein D and lipocalin family protein
MWARAAAAVLVTAGVLAPAVRAESNTAVRTVPSVDLDRYLGDWYEVARFPNRFQKRCEGDVKASYTRRADGTLEVVNRCRTEEGSIEARGVARVVDPAGARLKVRFAPAALSFLPFVWGDYWILALADDYSWALVGSPDRDYLWILSRAPVLGDRAFERAVDAARANGFDVDRLQKTPQATPAAG